MEEGTNFEKERPERIAHGVGGLRFGKKSVFIVQREEANRGRNGRWEEIMDHKWQK